MHVWSKSWGNATDQESSSVVTDASNNVIIGGYFTGSVDFGCGLVTAGVSDAALILKLTTDGNCLWTRYFGDPGLVNAATVDAAGNVYATGYIIGPADFGGGALLGNGGRDVFVVKYSAAGVYQWGKLFGDGNDQTGWGIGVDAAGNVFVGGSFYSTVNFGGATLTSQGAQDLFIAKLGPAGNHLWSKRFGDASNQIGRALTVDGAGNVLMTGNLAGSANFGGQTLTSPGLGNVFIAKLDGAGNHLWSATYGDASDQYAQAITTDAAGNVYACGPFDGTINFGGATLTTGGGQDNWVAKFTPAGVHVWSRGAPGPGNQSCNNVAVDSTGRVAVGGWFFGSADLGGGVLTSVGQQDGFMALYSATGKHIWSLLYGDPNVQVNKGLAFDNAGYLLVTAMQTGPIDLGGGPKVAGGGEDLFAAKLIP